jgi:hypothetical protein
LRSGEDLGQSLGEKYKGTCLIILSGCAWLSGMAQNLVENKSSLLHASYWHVRADDSPKHSRFNNPSWFWHRLQWKVEVTCLFSKWRTRPWTCIHFGTVLQQFFFCEIFLRNRINPDVLLVVGFLQQGAVGILVGSEPRSSH